MTGKLLIIENVLSKEAAASTTADVRRKRGRQH